MQSEKAGSTLEMYEKDGKMVIRNSKYHYQISLPNEYRYIISTMPEERRNGEKYDILFTEREYPNLSAHINKDLYEENREKWIEVFLTLEFYEG